MTLLVLFGDVLVICNKKLQQNPYSFTPIQ